MSVNRHVERTPADVMALVDHLYATERYLDPARLYASGFSMGSIKTFGLAEQYGVRFAAVAPMSGSFAPDPAGAPLVPTIYFAGLASPLPERPSQVGSANNMDARLASLFKANGVTDAYVFDATADSVWGIAPTQKVTYEDRMFADHSVTVETLKSKDGKTYTALAAVENQTHETTPIEATIAWEFISKFSRSADGKVVSKWSGLPRRIG